MKNKKYSLRYSLHIINSKKIISNCKNNSNNNPKLYNLKIHPICLKKIYNLIKYQLKIHQNSMTQSQESLTYQISMKLKTTQVFHYMKRCCNKKWFSSNNCKKRTKLWDKKTTKNQNKSPDSNHSWNKFYPASKNKNNARSAKSINQT